MNNNTTYIVTGAAGFLGSTIVRQLSAEGKKVRAFVLPSDKSWKYLPEDTEIVFGDLTDMESLEKLFTVNEGEDSVCLHIASIVAMNPDYSQKVMDVNVGGTKNIIDMVRNHPECRKLVYCSSTGAIPEAPRGTAIKEVDHFDETKVMGCYSMSKALATQAVLDAVKEYDINACVVHPSGILGPEDYAVGETTGTLIKIINGGMPAGVAGTFNLCDVRDLADGTIRAIENGRKGECYILGNDEVTFQEFCRMVSEEAGVKGTKFFLPASIANFMAKIAEKKAAKTGEKPLMTTFAIYNLTRNNVFDSSKAKKELGYTTRSYQETIRDEVAWLKKTGKIANASTVTAAKTPAHAK